jgi:hypothetical protein
MGVFFSFQKGALSLLNQAIAPDLCIAKMHTAVQKSQVSRKMKIDETHINVEQL